jgi:hypothetical protein
MDIFFWGYIDDQVYCTKSLLYEISRVVIRAVEVIPPQMCATLSRSMNVKWTLCRQQRKPRLKSTEVKNFQS